MAAANAWDPASAPNSAGLLLGHFVASGLVTQEMLNISKRTAPCFEKFSRLQQITNIQAEIYQVNYYFSFFNYYFSTYTEKKKNCSSVIMQVLSMCEFLGSIPSTHTSNQKKKTQPYNLN
uniref:HAUS augmin-like complex subunit 2 n=1 Tax=Urocitellus parryii TaxID=9999 RepID=A0A8D2HP11_UROPR